MRAKSSKILIKYPYEEVILNIMGGRYQNGNQESASVVENSF